MTKKVTFGVLTVVLGMLIVFGIVNPSFVKADSRLGTNLLGSVNVIPADNFKFSVIDMRSATDYEVFNLPTLEDHDGMTYVVKEAGGTTYTASVLPQSGESLEGVVNGQVNLGFNAYAIFVADEENDTWWLVSWGNQTF